MGAGRELDTWHPEPLDELDGYALHPEGHSLLVTMRGRMFALAGLWEGPAAAVGRADGTRYACAGFDHLGAPIAAACDALGTWSIELFTSDPCTTTTAPSRNNNKGGRAESRLLRPRGASLEEPTELAPNPEAARIAVATHDLRLLLIDVNTSVAVLLDHAEHDGGIFDLAWSADGAWLAYSVSTSVGARTSAIRLCDTRRKEPRVIEARAIMTPSRCMDSCSSVDVLG